MQIINEVNVQEIIRRLGQNQVNVKKVRILEEDANAGQSMTGYETRTRYFLAGLDSLRAELKSPAYILFCEHEGTPFELTVSEVRKSYEVTNPAGMIDIERLLK